MKIIMSIIALLRSFFSIYGVHQQTKISEGAKKDGADIQKKVDLEKENQRLEVADNSVSIAVGSVADDDGLRDFAAKDPNNRRNRNKLKPSPGL